MKKFLVVYGTSAERYFVTDFKTWLPSIEKRIASYNNYGVALEIAEVLNKNKEK